MKMPRPIISQQMYNILIRQLEIEYFKLTAKHPIHTTIYNPLAGGLLSGAPGKRFEDNTLYQRRYLSDAMRRATDALAAVSSSAGMSLVELAYRFVLRPGVDSILVGPGSLAHLEDAISAHEKGPLDESMRAKCDEISRALAGTDATYAR